MKDSWVHLLLAVGFESDAVRYTLQFPTFAVKAFSENDPDFQLQAQA